MKAARVICTDNSGYQYTLTEGKVYEVVREEPGTFTSDVYVVVIGDNGKEVAGHKYRFSKEAS